MKRLLRRNLEGVVCYIPGISSVHKAMEYEDVKQWAVRGENGNVYPILYHPESFQPPKSILFLARGEGGTLHASEELE